MTKSLKINHVVNERHNAGSIFDKAAVLVAGGGPCPPGSQGNASNNNYNGYGAISTRLAFETSSPDIVLAADEEKLKEKEKVKKKLAEKDDEKELEKSAKKGTEEDANKKDVAENKDTDPNHTKPSDTLDGDKLIKKLSDTDNDLDKDKKQVDKIDLNNLEATASKSSDIIDIISTKPFAQPITFNPTPIPSLIQATPLNYQPPTQLSGISYTPQVIPPARFIYTPPVIELPPHNLFSPTMANMLSANLNNTLDSRYVIDARNGGAYIIRAVQVTFDVGLFGKPNTPMWAYELIDSATGAPMTNSPNTRGMILGDTTNQFDNISGTPSGIFNPTILAQSYVPISIVWENGLPLGAHLLPLDTSILSGAGMGNMPGMSMATNTMCTITTPTGIYMVPLVTHVHGAHVAAIYDGNPNATITPDQVVTYVYDNSQKGAFIWYHDHSMGITRLNVYAGLEGGYLIDSATRDGLTQSHLLPDILNETPVIVSDKSFYQDGSLFYPAQLLDELPGTGSIVADVLPNIYDMHGNLVYATDNPNMFDTSEAFAKLAQLRTPYVIDHTKPLMTVGCHVCDVNGNWVKDNGNLQYFKESGGTYVLYTAESMLRYPDESKGPLFALDCANAKLYASDVPYGPYLKIDGQDVTVMHYDVATKDCFVLDMDGNYVKDTPAGLFYFWDDICNQYVLVTSSSIAMHNITQDTPQYLFDCENGKLYAGTTPDNGYLIDPITKSEVSIMHFMADYVVDNYGNYVMTTDSSLFIADPVNVNKYIVDNRVHWEKVGDHFIESVLGNYVANASGDFVIDETPRYKIDITSGSLVSVSDISNVIATNSQEVIDYVLPYFAELPIPTAVPEYFGNVIMANGKAWPHMVVAPGDVLIDLLNGSDSRFYDLILDNPWVKVTLVGTDQGLLPHPIVLMDGDGTQEKGEHIIFAPADRFQLLFDFSNAGHDGAKVVHLENIGTAYEPFKGLDAEGNLDGPVQGIDLFKDPVGQVMSFDINPNATAFHSDISKAINANTISDPGAGNSGMDGSELTDIWLDNTFKKYFPFSDSSNDLNTFRFDPYTTLTRKLGVFEVEDQFGRIMPQVGIAENKINQNNINVLAGGLGYDQPVTEIIQLGPNGQPVTEIWEFYNTTADAHPLHIHQVNFQVLGRYLLTQADGQGIGDTNADGVVLHGEADYNNDFGAEIPLYATDAGNQDTVWVGPGQGIKIIMTFDRPGDYMWHCHILSHEDHDMMRTFKVIGVTGDFTGMIGEHSDTPSSGLIEIGTLDNATQGFVFGNINGSHGILTMNENGNWSYSLNHSDPEVNGLGNGDMLFDTITVRELGGMTHDILITILGQNDAPILTPTNNLLGHNTPALTTELMRHDEVSINTIPPIVRWNYFTGGYNSAGQFMNGVSDTETSSDQIGIAITGCTGITDGIVQFSHDNGSTWITVDNAGVSESNALLFLGTDLFRFTPPLNAIGDRTITFHAWDGSGGFNSGDHVNLSGAGATGGSSPFSANTATETLTISPYDKFLKNYTIGPNYFYKDNWTGNYYPNNVNVFWDIGAFNYNIHSVRISTVFDATSSLPGTHLVWTHNGGLGSLLNFDGGESSTTVIWNGVTYTYTKMNREENSVTFHDLLITSDDPNLNDASFRNLVQQTSIRYDNNYSIPNGIPNVSMLFKVEVSQDGNQWQGADLNHTDLRSLTLVNSHPTLYNASFKGHLINLDFIQDRASINGVKEFPLNNYLNSQRIGDPTDTWWSSQFGQPNPNLFSISVKDSTGINEIKTNFGESFRVVSAWIDNSVILTVNGEIPNDAKVSVTYSAPSGNQYSNVVQDWIGNDALTGQVDAHFEACGEVFNVLPGAVFGCDMSDNGNYADNNNIENTEKPPKILSIDHHRITIALDGYYFANPSFDPIATSGFASFEFTKKYNTVVAEVANTFNYQVGDSIPWDQVLPNIIYIVNMTHSVCVSHDGINDLATYNIWSEVPAAPILLTDYANQGDSTRFWGDDVISGGIYNDSLYGSFGHDVIHGYAGNDIISVVAGGDSLYGDEGNDNFIVDFRTNSTLSSLFNPADANAISYIYDSSGIDSLRIIDSSNTNGPGFARYGIHGEDLVFQENDKFIVIPGQYHWDSGSHSYVSVIETVYLNNQNMHWNNTAVNLILGSNSTETQIYGSDTADILLAYGSGNTISGGAGNDYIIGSRLASQDEVDLYNERNHFTDSSDPNFLTLDKVMAGTLNTVGDILNGGAGDDYIKGKSGNDIIDGGEGNDTLKGKGGNDTFVFDTALNSDKNIDLIEGFTSGSDKIELHQSIFKELTAGITLNASNLFSSADITSGNDFSGSSQILFNTNTGALYYDADGSGSAHAIQFATLGSGLHPAITSSDFIVVA